MPAFKNQHFVPKCYLRQFGRVDGRSISLFNIRSRSHIELAAVKHQCSRSYFYGDDLALERGFHAVEGEYAALVRGLDPERPAIAAQGLHALRRFWLVQYQRTEAAGRRYAELSEEVDRGLADASASLVMSVQEAIALSMARVGDAQLAINDLSAVLLWNRSAVDFVTSDDPAVLTNRWYLQRGVTGAIGFGFGLGSSGAIGLLPISPRFALLLYDRDVYVVANEGGLTELSSETDATAINEHQYLGARENIYFANWCDRGLIAQEYSRCEDRRPVVRHRVRYAVSQPSQGSGEVFVEASQVEFQAAERGLVHMLAVFPDPSSWPSVIRRRANGRAYSTGGGTGFVRRAHTSSERHFRVTRT